MWEIQDDNGVIHSGSQEEMECAFDVISNNLNDELSISEIRILQHQHDCLFIGDLKLVEIHKRYK